MERLCAVSLFWVTSHVMRTCESARARERERIERWFERPDTDHQITTKISIEGFAHVRREGLLAHATQIDPDSPFWFGLPVEIDESLYTVDDYRLAHGHELSTVPEDDLFAGLRPAPVNS